MRFIIALFVFTLCTTELFAIPVDWKGMVGFDSHTLIDIKGNSGVCTTGGGSQCVGSDNQHARFQTSFLSLRPQFLINDTVSFFAELSVGAFRGEFLGQDASYNDSLFSQSQAGASTLNFTQSYLELYSDMGLIRVGKFSKHQGLGVLINGGDNFWDRFPTIYSGFEADFFLGKLKVTPTWAKIASPQNDQFQSSSPYSNKYDVNELGLQGTYDDDLKGLTFSFYYANRTGQSSQQLYGSNTGSQDLTLIDIYLKKSFEKLSLALEVPMITGKVGRIYNTSTAEDIQSYAYIFEGEYLASESWKVGFGAGLISGEDGQDDVSAMYLHPDYQVARIMGRYNRAAFQSSGQNPMSSGLSNMTYLKLKSESLGDSLDWIFSFVWARANEVAQAGSQAFNHESKQFFTANFDQSDDLGMELDLEFRYRWSEMISFTGYYAYYQLGDYFAFSNASNNLDLKNITATGLSLEVGF